MWWLLLHTLLLSAAPHQGEARGTDPPLEAAMVGYSPIMANLMEQPDKGRKSTIFIPWERDPICVQEKEDVVNGFVDSDRQTQCHPSLTEAIVRNYEDFKHLTIEALSFASEGSATTPLRAAQFNFKEKAGYGNLNNPNDLLLRNFFNQSEGEGRFIKVECVTHTVRILPFHEPVFTPAFKSAMLILQEAAMDTNSDNIRNVFSEFVRSYGTHFARTTHFGYVSYYAKLFATQPKAPAEEAARRRCMMESARETMSSGARTGCETMSQQVFRGTLGRCGEEDVELMIPEISRASNSGVEDCDSAANTSPKPVAYVLEKISTLFQEQWITSRTLDTNQIRLNSTTLSSFMDEYLGEYSQYVIERAESSSRNQGSWGRYVTPKSCNINEGVPEEEVDSSSDYYGGIIIVGGYPPSAANSLAFLTHAPPFMPAPPSFPVYVQANTLSQVGSVLYSCGGDDGNSKKCWHIDTGTQDTTWDSFDIPWPLSYHSAVVVQDVIWFFVNSKLMILHTKNTTNKFSEISLGFSFDNRLCAVVAHDSQIFVIGVGGGRDEIYINEDYTKPDQWKRLSQLMQGRYAFGCIVKASALLVTGGREADNSAHLSSVEWISIVDSSGKFLGPLTGVRAMHQMAIIQDRPAVLGGYNGTNMATIESYNERKNTWEVLDLSLGEPRCNFGLVQYHR